MCILKEFSEQDNDDLFFETKEQAAKAAEEEKQRKATIPGLSKLYQDETVADIEEL